MICVYNRPNDHNATIIRYIGCMKSTGYTRVCVVTQNVHKTPNYKITKTSKMGSMSTLSQQICRGIELKNSVKESFRPIDRSLWSSVMLEALVASSATFHSTYFSLCQLLYARRPRRFNRSSWRSLYCACRHVSNLPQSPHKLPEAPAQALGLDNSWEFVARWDLDFEAFWGPLQAE